MVLIYAKKWRKKAFYQFNLPAAMSMYGSDTKAFKLGASSSLLVTQGCNTNNCKPIFWINKKKIFFWIIISALNILIYIIKNMTCTK